MQQLIITDWGFIWTVVGTAVTIFVTVITFITWLARKYKKSIQETIEKAVKPLIEHNKSLNEMIQIRLQLPRFALDRVELMEKTFEIAIEEVKEQRDRALAEKDSELAKTLQTELESKELLASQIIQNYEERNKLQNQFHKVAFFKHNPTISFNGVSVPTASIMLVKYDGKYGAFQPIEQSSSPKEFTRYAWWYQPDGSMNFINESVESGLDKVSNSVNINIGAIRLGWSGGGESYCWIYFGPTGENSDRYELQVTEEINIRTINPTLYIGKFVKAAPKYTIKLNPDNKENILEMLKEMTKIYPNEIQYTSSDLTITLYTRNSKIIEEIGNSFDKSTIIATIDKI